MYSLQTICGIPFLLTSLLTVPAYASLQILQLGHKREERCLS